MEGEFMGTLPQWITAIVGVLVFVGNAPARTRRQIVGLALWGVPIAALVGIFHLLGLAVWLATVLVVATVICWSSMIKYYPTLRKHTFHLLFHDE